MDRLTLRLALIVDRLLPDDDGSTADRDAANEVSTKRLNDELYGERR